MRKRMRVPAVALLVPFALAASAAAAALTGCGSSTPSTAADAKAVYYCPMHPTYTSDRPGDCPICNMKLVKREPAAPAPAPPADAKDVCIMHECPMLKTGESCPMMVVAKTGEQASCPACGTHVTEPAGKKVLYWTDPMMPGYKAEGPGKSPMGMDLVPVYEESGAQPRAGNRAPEGYAPILVTPQKRQLIGVRTGTVEKRRLTKTIRTVGRIAYDPELYQAQQEYLSAIRAWKEAGQGGPAEAVGRAKQLVDSSRVRLRILGLSQQMIDEVAAQDGPDKSLLVTDPGGKAWLYAPVYEYELPLVRVGQTVEAESPSLPGHKWSGVVRSVDSVLDPVTRTARVRAQVTDEPGVLKPEMFVNCSVTVDGGQVLAMPAEALFDTGAQRIVFVDKGEGLFEPRDVTVGMRAGDFYEVKSGLSEGESVVTSGNFLIDSESRLHAALEGAGASSGGHAHGS